MSLAGRRTTSETPSTTMPITRPPMRRMMTTVKASYFASASANLTRRSITGTMMPRRLMTPLRYAGAAGIGVTLS